MMAPLVDLGPQRSQSPPRSHLSQATMQDMALLCEETPPGPNFNVDANHSCAGEDLALLCQSHKLSSLDPRPFMSPSDTETMSLAPALATRSADAVIADLKRGQQNSHIAPAAKRFQKDLEQELKSDKITIDTQHEDPEDEAADANSDAEDQLVKQPKPRKISERKRAQIATFDSWFQSYAKKQAKVSSSNIDTDSESQSIKTLVRQSDSQQIISSPWEYQVELFERAKERNIIAVLDTGSGKTFIAVLLLRHVIEQELEDRAMGKQKRISFFLVDSVQLIFQQYAFLECNLNQPMAYICGQMGCDLWNKDLWEKQYSENMVVVCTAEVLRHCLHFHHISMDRINLLIFDEAHHAKKDHPYARIMKDFYFEVEDKSKRPKVFGMTASPADARVDVKQAAAELEAILHSQIATASDPSLLRYADKTKVELVADYGTLRLPFETPLYQQLIQKLGNNEVFKKILRYAKLATSELGPWCADHIWRIALEEEEMRRLEAKTERKFVAPRVNQPLKEVETQMAQLQEARKIVDAHMFEEPHPTVEYLSTKVLKLIEYLRERFERDTEDKCIIFATQRHTVRLLAELFSHQNIRTQHLRVGTLVGGTHGDVGDIKASYREQVITLMRFRKGLINCLFATSVAEEGLDVPDCNLVIRFDLYTTLIQYIQSRGRARLPNSKYIHMIERGNREHSALLKEVKRNETVLQQFCQSLPADRLLMGNDFNMDYFLGKEKLHRVYKEPTTGAKLNYKISLLVLANFVASLPHNGETALSPEYVMAIQNKQFICEVILPETSPIRGAIGRQASTKQVAKCSAAFEACILLRQSKYLDASFMSTYVKQLPAMRNAQLAISAKKQSAYAIRSKPEIWSVGSLLEEVFLTVLILANPSNLERSCQPLGLLTRSSLPQLPEIPLFFGKGRQSRMLSKPFPNGIHFSTELLDKINNFTLRVFDDVFSKEFEPDIAQMPYLLVPLKISISVSKEEVPQDIIDWDLINFIQDNEDLKWDDETPESFFLNRYIVDPFDGSRKLWSHHVTHKYKALDPVPPNTAPRTARKNTDNIMEYSCSLFPKARARRTFRENQRVLEAEFIPPRKDLLDDTEYAESELPTKCFIILEPLKISALPTTVVAMAYLFPFTIHRIEAYLIALEACSILHLDIQPDLVLEALTKDSNNTHEHGEEQISFQRGMGKNYERLEFLGDCFLKMATSISLYTQHPTEDEYQYHVKRMLMICNQNLLNNALKLKLYEYIRSSSFIQYPRAWYPKGLKLRRGKSPTHPASHNLADKTIADVSEALIGAALLTHYETKNFDLATRAVTELVCSTDHTATSYQDYYKSYEKPKYQTAPSTASQRDLAMQVEQKHAYHFKYPRLLRSAFVHPSYPFSYERVPSYQRLEFLGDSLLDMACINFLFHRFPGRDPQWLTEHKMAMVSNQFLGALCISLGFHKHLLQFNSMLQRQITEYVAELNEACLEAEEEAIKAGKAREDRSPDYWVHTKPPPKCLPDIVEAYIGAIFVDSEFDYSEVERFFIQHIQPYFENIDLYDTFANKHPITFLSNFLSVRMGCMSWKIFARQLPDIGDGIPPQIVATIMIHDQIITDHQSTSVRYAKKSAAEKARDLLVGLSPADFRAVYHCDCKTDENSEQMLGGKYEVEMDVDEGYSMH